MRYYSGSRVYFFSSFTTTEYLLLLLLLLEGFKFQIALSEEPRVLHGKLCYQGITELHLCVTGAPGDYKRCRCASPSLIFPNSGLEKWNFAIYMLLMTTVYCCCSWGWDLCHTEAIQSWVSRAAAAHTSCAAPELCGAASSSGWQLVAATVTSPAAVTGLRCTQTQKSGCQILPSLPPNTKGHLRARAV